MSVGVTDHLPLVPAVLMSVGVTNHLPLVPAVLMSVGVTDFSSSTHQVLQVLQQNGLIKNVRISIFEDFQSKRLYFTNTNEAETEIC